MTTIEKILLFGAAPAVLLLSLLEALVLSRRDPDREAYDWRAYGVSLFDFVGRIAVTLFVPLSIASPLIAWVVQHRLTTIPLDSVGSVLLLFITLEFFYYWLHRAGHRVRWFWCNHAVHHTPNQLNLGASLRIGMFGKLTGNVVFLLPLVWIGFDLRLVLAALSLNLTYQFWIHATWIPKLGWLAARGQLSSFIAHNEASTWLRPLQAAAFTCRIASTWTARRCRTAART